ncbi:MAG: hypothetical protein LBI16_05490 [Burkholderiales bacterium]|jgi:hypothetical protein|nr:hypothetical protein [Burkholderiales bacterium]
MRCFITIIFLFFANIVFASGVCVKEVSIGVKTVALGKTTLKQIESDFGYVGHFRFGGYATAVSYRQDEQFITFGFKTLGLEPTLSVVEISALPPNGYERLFFRDFPLKEKLFLEGRFVGQSRQNLPSSIHWETYQRAIKETGRGFACYLTTQSVYFYDRLLSATIAITESDSTNCLESPIDLSFVEKNFDELYKKNCTELWETLYSSLEEAKSCRSIEKTSRFLGLANLQTGNAEFEHFFSESIENLCLGSPKCFNEASQRLPKAAQEKLKEKLSIPLFINKERLYKSGCLPSTSLLERVVN